ncbi:MAG: hypothetical protein HKP30_12995, partial [Myxococcales bacterium]|nr:hypothetical protein [Myxococcales bacterium]
VVLQLALWSTAGLGVLALAVADAWRTRAPAAIVLLLWVFGVFVLASLLNWSVNVRSILPLVPAAAVLAARRIARRRSTTGRSGLPLAAGLAASAALSLSVAHADSLLAASARDAARTLVTEYRRPGRMPWFQGHWGFQYYAEALGAKPLHRGAALPRNAFFLVPRNNSYLWPIDAPIVELRRFRGPTWCATMNADVGGGFYSSIWGPMPFAFGEAPPETYVVHESPRRRPRRLFPSGP